MRSNILDEFTYKIGWKRNIVISFFGKECGVVVKLKAYKETDFITPEQEASYTDFISNKDKYLKECEEALSKYNSDYKSVYAPSVVLFNRDGSFALLLDDGENPDEGIAVTLGNKIEIISQDDYL